MSLYLMASSIVGLCYVAKQRNESAKKDITLFDQNVEALTQGENPGMMDDRTAWLSVLSSGDCGYKYEIRTVSWSEEGGKSKVSVDIYSDPKSGKLFTVSGNASFSYPSCNYKETLKDVKIVITGHWRVCETSFHTCDRALQVLCNGTRSSYTTLNRPSNAL